MKIERLQIADILLLTPTRHVDSRGFFSETFRADVFAEHGVNATFNYTWSHSIDNASDGQDYVANATQPDNSYRTDLERANSNFDARHRFVAAVTYDLPNFWLKHPRIGKGWQFNTVVTFRSGSPFAW